MATKPRRTNVRQGTGGSTISASFLGIDPITLTPSRTTVVASQPGSPSRAFRADGGAILVTQEGDWPQCGPKPAPTSRTTQCGPGFTGSWQQTRDWVAAAYPTCWTQDNVPWLPASPPSGACTPIAPPPAAFRYDLSLVNEQSQEFADFIGFCNRQDEPGAYDLIIAFKLTGTDSYRTRALAIIDAQVAAARADIAAGRDPDLAGDSYLYADADFITPAAFCAALGSPSGAQIAAWREVYDQALFNIWNPTLARWGTRDAEWSGWSIDNPQNNYNMHFMRATTAWALATNNAEYLDHLRSTLWPRVVASMGTIAGGGSVEGTGYGYAYLVLYDAMKIWRDSTGDNFTVVNTQLANTLRYWVHAAMPTLDRFLPVGDQPRVSEPMFYDYQRALLMLAADLADGFDNAAANNADHLLSFMRPQHSDVYRANYVDDLYPYNTGAPPPQALTFRAAESGMIAARTAWTPDAIGLWLTAGWFTESHMAQEQGQFTFWGQRTWLAVTSNIWSRSGIHQETDDKNVVRFEDAQGVIPQQRYVLPDVLAYVANPATGEMHVVLDLTPLYARGVRSWKRAVDFSGGMATIIDTVDLAPGTSAFFQLNTPVRPVVNGASLIAGRLSAAFNSGAVLPLGVQDMSAVDDYRGGFRVSARFSTTLSIILRVV